MARKPTCKPPDPRAEGRTGAVEWSGKAKQWVDLLMQYFNQDVAEGLPPDTVFDRYLSAAVYHLQFLAAKEWHRFFTSGKLRGLGKVQNQMNRAQTMEEIRAASAAMVDYFAENLPLSFLEDTSKRKWRSNVCNYIRKLPHP